MLIAALLVLASAALAHAPPGAPKDYCEQIYDADGELASYGAPGTGSDPDVLDQYNEEEASVHEYDTSSAGAYRTVTVTEAVKDRDITHLRVSPLERAQETAQPLADLRGLDIVTDERIIESTNVFEGKGFGPADNTLRKPKNWIHLWNPFRPSWGEPYKQVAARMLSALGHWRRPVLRK